MHDHPFSLSTILLVALVSVGAAPEEPPGISPTPALEISLQVVPSYAEGSVQLLTRPTPSTFTCTALITEVGSKRGFAAPKLVVARGASEHKSAEVAGYNVTFRAAITAIGDRANTDLTISRGALVVSRQRSSTWLPRSDPKSTAPVP